MRGFTLIETLLYITILSILLTGVLACMEELIISSSTLKARAQLIYESVYLTDVLDTISSSRTVPETDSRFTLSSFGYTSDSPLPPTAVTASGTLGVYAQSTLVQIPFRHTVYEMP